MVTARLEGHIKRCGIGTRSRLIQGKCLSMRAACPAVPAGTHDLATFDDYRPDHWVGTGFSAAALGEAKSQAHETVVRLVTGARGHASIVTDPLRRRNPGFLVLVYVRTESSQMQYMHLYFRPHL